MLTLIALTATFSAGWWSRGRFGTVQSLYSRSHAFVVRTWNDITKG